MKGKLQGREEEAIAMYRAGATYKAIGQVFGVHPSSVNQMLRRRGEPYRPNQSRPEEPLEPMAPSEPEPPDGCDVRDRLTTAKWRRNGRRMEYVRLSDGLVMDYRYL